jgi:hypothetical protein
MRLTRRRTAVILVILGVAGLLVGTCGLLVDRWLPRYLVDRGADHPFPLPGDAPLTEEQAAEIAGQVLALDGRDVADLQLMGADGAAPATRNAVQVGTDGSLMLTYRHRVTRWFWYVVLRREPGRVVGFSYHGT